MDYVACVLLRRETHDMMQAQAESGGDGGSGWLIGRKAFASPMGLKSILGALEERSP